jgi:hypothetical protein
LRKFKEKDTTDTKISGTIRWSSGEQGHVAQCDTISRSAGPWNVCEHKAPRATPGGPLMNHCFRVGNRKQVSESSAPICRHSFIQIIIERAAGVKENLNILTQFIQISRHNYNTLISRGHSSPDTSDVVGCIQQRFNKSGKVYCSLSSSEILHNHQLFFLCFGKYTSY